MIKIADGAEKRDGQAQKGNAKYVKKFFAFSQDHQLLFLNRCGCQDKCVFEKARLIKISLCRSIYERQNKHCHIGGICGIMSTSFAEIFLVKNLKKNRRLARLALFTERAFYPGNRKEKAAYQQESMEE